VSDGTDYVVIRRSEGRVYFADAQLPLTAEAVDTVLTKKRGFNLRTREMINVLNNVYVNVKANDNMVLFASNLMLNNSYRKQFVVAVEKGYAEEPAAKPQQDISKVHAGLTDNGKFICDGKVIDPNTSPIPLSCTLDMPAADQARADHLMEAAIQRNKPSWK